MILAEIHNIVTAVPPWAAGIGFIAVSFAAAFSLPFAFRQMSIWDWVRVRIFRQPARSPHAYCPHSAGARRHTELHGEWRELKGSWKSLYVRESMDFGERILEDVALTLKDSYREELQSHTEINESARAADYDVYCLIIEKWRNELEDRFRLYVRENGFASMSHEEWVHYLEVKTASMMATASGLFDLYHLSKIIPRSQVKAIMKPHEPEIIRKVESCFTYVRGRAMHYLDLRQKKYKAWAVWHFHIYEEDPIEEFE